MEKNILSTNGDGRAEHSYGKNKPLHIIHTIYKNNSKSVIDLNVNLQL